MRWLLPIALIATIVVLVVAPNGGGKPSIVAAASVPPFHFSAIGKVFGPADFGATTPGFFAGTADISAAVLPDGRIRLYAFVNFGQFGIGSIRSAISQDGIHFTAEPGIRVCEDTGGCGQTRVVPLPGGGWRLFFTSFNGIASATSSDGMTFVRDPGTRITVAQAGISPPQFMTVGSVIGLATGGYRMYFSSSWALAGPPPPDRILSATSADMLTWTMDPGVRVGPDSPTLPGSGAHPFALANPDGTVTLLYNAFGQGDPPRGGLFYSTSRDGLVFSDEQLADLPPTPIPPDRLGMQPGDPDLIARPDGSYLMYYDNFDPTIGSETHVARVITDDDLALSGVPADVDATALIPGGANVKYTSPTAADEDPSAPRVTCDPTSGSIFPVGTTTVHCSASDGDDLNTPATATFTVTVVAGYCVVPNVNGRLLARAKRAITAAQCSVGQVQYRRSKKNRGIVIAQSPQPGSQLEAGELVNLVVSRGRK